MIENFRGQIVRIKNRSDNQTGLFLCSDVVIGDQVAGNFLDNQEGAMVPISGIEEIVPDERAKIELDAWRRDADKARIKQVVASVANSEEEFSGNIVLHVSFVGSLQKSKALSKQELQELKSSGLSERSWVIGLTHSKRLFKSEEYDAIESFEARRRQEFANLGIPFPLGAGMHLVRIVNIPKAEDLARKTQDELDALVLALVAAYPGQITPEAVNLGPLYNPGDYKAVEALPALFKFKTKWMHFGVPEVLKEIDQALWEKERQRTAEVWREAKEQGLILLRQTVADMTARLVEAVTPDDKGGKKRFYATTITNMRDFFEVFEDRNLADDTQLSEQVEKLKRLINNKDIDQLKNDDGLREFVKKEGSKIQASLETLLVDAGARTITFGDE